VTPHRQTARVRPVRPLGGPASAVPTPFHTNRTPPVIGADPRSVIAASQAAGRSRDAVTDSPAAGSALMSAVDVFGVLSGGVLSAQQSERDDAAAAEWAKDADKARLDGSGLTDPQLLYVTAFLTQNAQ
jgi:hypothetical protein